MNIISCPKCHSLLVEFVKAVLGGKKAGIYYKCHKCKCKFKL